jgi:hypothetical protein
MQKSRYGMNSLLAAIASVLLAAAFLPATARATANPGPDDDRPRNDHSGRGAHAHAHGSGGAATDTVMVYSGRAFGAQVKVLVPLPSTRLYADTGILASAGGSISASLASITDAVFSSGPTSCSSQGSGALASSVSAMARVSAYANAAAALSCTSLQANTSASCVGVTGSTTISELVFAGVAVVVTGAANQTVSVPGVATLVINEQIRAAGSITVNALHLTLASGEELTLCSSHSDIGCSTTPTRSTTWGEVKAIYR